MATKTSTPQKMRRSLQERAGKAGRPGKRAVRGPRTAEKQRQGDLQRRHAGA